MGLMGSPVPPTGEPQRTKNVPAASPVPRNLLAEVGAWCVEHPVKALLILFIMLGIAIKIQGRGPASVPASSVPSSSSDSLPQPSPPYSTSTADNAPTVATQYAFVRGLLNQGPAAVAGQLGGPDRPLENSRDCDYLPECVVGRYGTGRYEALYFGDRLKWLHINDSTLFGRDAIQRIGFPSVTPTWENNVVVAWRSAATRGTAKGPLVTFDGLLDVSVFRNYLLVRVKKDFNGRL
jgi:hypothetical protein